MSIARLVAIAGSVLLLAHAASADVTVPPGQPIPRGELERFIDGAVADAMVVDHIAGVSVAVVQSDSTTLLRGYGNAGAGRAVDPQRTLFRIASISKTFTWIGLMREVERGRIRLDAPVNDYLPAELRIPEQGFRQPIRIIDLMSHSPGFEDRSFAWPSIHDGTIRMALGEALLRGRPNRVREPGKIASYSNYGAALAGYIAARSAGIEFEELMEREIFQPLGMASTTFREPYARQDGLPAPMSRNLAADLAIGFIWDGADYRPLGFEFIGEMAPNGSASSTAADMARYIRTLLAGGSPIFGAETAAAFRTPILHVAPGVNGWAHGFMMRTLPGGYMSYGHGGSLSAYFSNLVLVPELGLGVFVAANTSTGKPFVERLPALIVQRFYVPETVKPRLPGDGALATRGALYAGTYYTTRRAYSGLQAFMAFVGGGDRVSVTPEGYLQTRVAGHAESWVPDVVPGQFRSVSGGPARLRFNLDDSGRAVSFPGARGTFSLERAGLLLEPQPFHIFAALVLVTALLSFGHSSTRICGNAFSPRWQRRVHVLTTVTSAAWLAALIFFGVWFAHAADPMRVIDWPEPLLTTASSFAFIGTVGSIGLLALTPLVLRAAAGKRRSNPWRKAQHVFVVVVFLVFAVLVAARGGLLPWM